MYDSGDQDILVARITTQEYTTRTDYKILEWRKSALLAESYVRLGKQATIEKRYIIKQLRKLETAEIKTPKSILRKLFLL